MKLPPPKDPFFVQSFTILEREDARNYKRNQDVEIGMNSLILTAPNGTRYKLVVSNLGVLSATPV